MLSKVNNETLTIAYQATSRINIQGNTLGVRDEGVPVRDILGINLAFRRPGYAISLAPGFIYSNGIHMIQASVGIAMVRNREGSVPDILQGSAGGVLPSQITSGS
jgi:hypothetical protein